MFGNTRSAQPVKHFLGRISLKVKIVAALGAILALAGPPLCHQREVARQQYLQQIEIGNIIKSWFDGAIDPRLDSIEREFQEIIRKRSAEIGKEIRQIEDRGTPIKNMPGYVELSKADQKREKQLKFEQGEINAEARQVWPEPTKNAEPDRKAESRPLGRALAYWQSQIKEQERQVSSVRDQIEGSVSSIYLDVARLGETSDPKLVKRDREIIAFKCRGLKDMLSRAAAPVSPVPKDRRAVFEKAAQFLRDALGQINELEPALGAAGSSGDKMLAVIHAQQALLHQHLQPIQDLLTKDDALRQAAKLERQVQPLPEACNSLI